jgi:DNA polymerase-4
VWEEPILHVDMDSFFVEVERLADPTLRGIPVAVGGTGPRGVIASASYEARAFGVRSAQPTAMALQACPGLRVVPSDHGRYAEVSIRVFELLRSFTPMVEGLSVDEAFLDVSGLRRHHRSPVEVGEDIRAGIRSELGLPSSVGVAATKLMAKLASESAKPDGLRHVPRSGQVEFLHSLPASVLPGVGPATQAALAKLGVETVSDLAQVPPATMERSLGRAMGRQLAGLAAGIDNRKVEPDSEAKSLSVEETFDLDLEGVEVIGSALLALAHRLSVRLRRSGLSGRTVTLKVRFGDFRTVTRSRTIEGPVDGWRDLSRIAGELLAELDAIEPVRLLGLAATTLEPSSRPRQLDIDSSQGWDRVEDAVFEVRSRYGERAIRPARLLDEDG